MMALAGISGYVHDDKQGFVQYHRRNIPPKACIADTQVKVPLCYEDSTGEEVRLTFADLDGQGWSKDRRQSPTYRGILWP